MALGTILSKSATVYIPGLVAGITSGGKTGIAHVFAAMAIITSRFGMGTGQGEFRALAMVERNLLPAKGRMATGAGQCKAAAVHIVRGMAVRAVGLCLFEHRRFVTALAGSHHMQSEQGIFRQPVVKLNVVAPGHRIVAIRAILAKACLVHILFCVAADAFHRNFIGEIPAVAILARGLGMGAAKRKAGILVMVKFGLPPTFRAMAGLAFCAKTPLMHILDGMAVIAGGRQVLINFAEMTVRASHILVLARQRKFCLRMIKGRNLGPLARLMACLAFLTEVLLMGLRGAVTGKACGWRIGPSLSLGMAPTAFHLLMCPFQRKIRGSVVESFEPHQDDARIPAMMLGVAIVASQAGHERAFPVKSGLCRSVRKNGLVASEA